MPNAFQMFLDLRSNIGEDFGSEQHWTDRRLLSALNAAQLQVALMISKAQGDWLIKSASVTPSNGKITLPSDCVRPVYLEQTEQGYPIPFDMTVRERRVSRPIGASIDLNFYAEGYFEDSYITINQDSFTDACTLWYEKRVPDLHFGTAATGTGALALVLDAGNVPSFVDDYYNNVTVETMNTTDYYVKLRSTISDYTASTKTCVITGTATAADYYGTISLLPEETHELIVIMATAKVLSKPSSSIDPNDRNNWLTEAKVLRKEIEEWLSTRKASTGRIRDTGDY